MGVGGHGGGSFHCSDLLSLLAQIQPLWHCFQTAQMDGSLPGLMGIGPSFLVMFMRTTNQSFSQPVSQSVAEHSHRECGHWKSSSRAPFLDQAKTKVLPMSLLHSLSALATPNSLLFIFHARACPPRAFALTVSSFWDVLSQRCQYH